MEIKNNLYFLIIYLLSIIPFCFAENNVISSLNLGEKESYISTEGDNINFYILIQAHNYTIDNKTYYYYENETNYYFNLTINKRSNYNNTPIYYFYSSNMLFPNTSENFLEIKRHITKNHVHYYFTTLNNKNGYRYLNIRMIEPPNGYMELTNYKERPEFFDQEFVDYVEEESFFEKYLVIIIIVVVILLIIISIIIIVLFIKRNNNSNENDDKNKENLVNGESLGVNEEE